MKKLVMFVTLLGLALPMMAQNQGDNQDFLTETKAARKTSKPKKSLDFFQLRGNLPNEYIKVIDSAVKQITPDVTLAHLMTVTHSISLIEDESIKEKYLNMLYDNMGLENRSNAEKVALCEYIETLNFSEGVKANAKDLLGCYDDLTQSEQKEYYKVEALATVLRSSRGYLTPLTTVLGRKILEDFNNK